MDPRIAGQRIHGVQRERTERTPYYMTGLPAKAAFQLMRYEIEFRRRFGRTYEDEDPQFWRPNPDGTIRDIATELIPALVRALRRSNHHPAHIHAVEATQRVIWGCGRCVDDCAKCNFRYVPELWTREWKQACESSEEWRNSLVQPSFSDLLTVARGKR